MAKKKTAVAPTATEAPAVQAPVMQTPANPQAMPGMMPQMPMGGMPMPGMPMPGMQGNPMFAMMQMMQMMMGGGLAPAVVDPAALPFTGSAPVQDGDKGLDADIIRPSLLSNCIKTQQGVKLGSVLDVLCLTDDREHALGGVPKGCTIALAGPPGKGKTRTVLAGLAKVARQGHPVGFVIAEEVGNGELTSRCCRTNGKCFTARTENGCRLANRSCDGCRSDNVWHLGTYAGKQRERFGGTSTWKRRCGG